MMGAVGVTTSHASTERRPLDAESGHDAIMLEVARLCEAAGDPEAARFYAWSNKGLWRVPDRSEPGPMDIGANRDDMQMALELDVAAYVRLRRRREAIASDKEPDWSLAITAATRTLLKHAGEDPSVPLDRMEDHGIGRNGLRVDTVTHRRGCILSSIHIGTTSQGPVHYDSFEDRSEIRISGLELPQTVLTGIAGCMLSHIMPHALLDAIELKIAGADTVPAWGPGRMDTILRIVDTWEPLVEACRRDRSWLKPLPLPHYA